MTAEPMRKCTLLDLIPQQGGAHLGCEDQGSVVCSNHGGFQDPERMEEGEKQAHNTCLQESWLWPLQESVQKSPMA